MKVTQDDIVISDDKKRLNLFTQSTKSDRTRYVYECKLRQILCEYLEDVLSGTFEERAAQLLDLGRNKPAQASGMMRALARGAARED